MAIRTKDFVQLGFLLSNTGTLRSVMCFEIRIVSLQRSGMSVRAPPFRRRFRNVAVIETKFSQIAFGS
jgi:hypothetical protein